MLWLELLTIGTNVCGRGLAALSPRFPEFECSESLQRGPTVRCIRLQLKEVAVQPDADVRIPEPQLFVGALLGAWA